jgi:hypothetical protein
MQRLMGAELSHITPSWVPIVARAGTTTVGQSSECPKVAFNNY